MRDLAVEHSMKPRAVLVMGVSGSGKSTVGKALADRMDWTFADADDYHPPANREKMSRGEPLTDEDRQPWLEKLHDLITEHALKQKTIVLACSALKEKYREILVGDLEGVTLVFLRGDAELIAERMRHREHFMPVSLLETQLATLEPPTDAIIVDIAQPLETMLEQVIAQLGP
jgi:gluconokinase